MSASLMQRFSPNFRRRIDDHYLLAMVVNNSSQIIEYHDEAYRLQCEAAITNLQGLTEIAKRQGETNSILYSIAEGLGDLNYSLNFQTEILCQEFEEMARLVLQQQQTLEQIADVLRRPYKAKALELLEKADYALKTGMNAEGRNQQEWFANSLFLLNEVLANPIGNFNYVAWFQKGWLKWKYEQSITEAEEAFYQAARFSSPQADLYHATSLRHMAYMQYLQKKYSGLNPSEWTDKFCR